MAYQSREEAAEYYKQTPEGEYVHKKKPYQEMKKEREEEAEEPKQKYQKEFRGREQKSERGFVRPKVFESTEEAEEYLQSLPPKQRYEEESRLKGFRSGEERRRIIEQVNRERVRRGDIEAAESLYGTPQEKYTELEEKARGLYGRAKEVGGELKTAGRQAIGLEDRTELIEKLKSGGKYVVGAAALKLTPRLPFDIRNLEKARKELAKKEFEERKRAKIEKHQQELEIAQAYGGIRPQRQKARPAPRGRSLEQRMGVTRVAGGFSLGNMNLGGGRPVARPIVRSQRRVEQVSVRPQESDLLGLSEFSGMRQKPLSTEIKYISKGKPIERRVEVVRERPQQQMQYNPTNNPSANFLVSMNRIDNVKSLVNTKKGKKSTDPFGASNYF